MTGLAGRSAIALVRGYQRVISPLLPGQCRFYPSCSEYAVQCFTHYSFPRALFKSTYRILRCNPLSEGYFDPAVPPEPEAEPDSAHARARPGSRLN